MSRFKVVDKHLGEILVYEDEPSAIHMTSMLIQNYKDQAVDYGWPEDMDIKVYEDGKLTHQIEMVNKTLRPEECNGCDPVECESSGCEWSGHGHEYTCNYEMRKV